MVFSSKLIVFMTCLVGGAFGETEIIKDGAFILEYYLLPNETISVTATVRATGWVGVGLSETDDMVYADSIMGGVRNGAPYIGDYFSTSNVRPVLDESQDILSYSAEENATHTILHFTRLADTGDEFQDIPLSRAVYIIWGYHDTSDNPLYHGVSNRGAFLLRKENSTQV